MTPKKKANKVSFNSPISNDKNNRNHFSSHGQSAYLTTDGSITPGRASIRKSVMVPKFINYPDELWQLTLSKKKEKAFAKKVQEKKYYLELKQLVKERIKFRASLVQTADAKSLELLSRKILKVNERITNIMKKITGETQPLLMRRDSPLFKEDEMKFNSDKMDFSGMKDDLKKIENYLRVNELIFEGKIMDMKQSLQVRPQSSYFFQRRKIKTLYEPSTDLGKNTNTRNRFTLFQKGYKPFGFRTSRDQKPFSLIPSTFEDVYYQYEERQKRKEKEDDDKEKDRLNNEQRTVETEPTYRCKTESTEPKAQSLKYKSKKHRRLATACLVQQNTEQLLTNTKIINESIKMTMKEDKQTVRSNHYKKLLFLLAKKLEKPKKIKEKVEKEYNQEQLYSDRLKKLPQSAKPLFRNVFKIILSEDRHLNKANPLHIDPYDQKIQYLKRQKDFQKEAYKNMYLLKEQADKINDDEEVFKDIKIFDNYGNLDSLEWLLKKRNALKPDHKNTGAYNPYEKVAFNIHYKDI